MATITKQSHPRLHEAFEMISHDRGSSAGHASYEVPAKYEPFIETTEAALASLSEAELIEFCIGDAVVADDISRRSGAMSGAHTFLNAFFEDWS